MLSQIIVFVINKYILFCHGWQSCNDVGWSLRKYR